MTLEELVNYAEKIAKSYNKTFESLGNGAFIAAGKWFKFSVNIDGSVTLYEKLFGLTFPAVNSGELWLTLGTLENMIRRA